MEDITIIEGTQIKNHLPAILGDRKMSIRALSEKTGITYTMIRDLYHGSRSSVQWTTVDAVCRVLGIGVGNLFEYLDDKVKVSQGEVMHE